MGIGFFLVLGFLGAILYLLIPSLLGLLIDVEDPCAYGPSMADGGPQGLRSAVSELCSTSEIFVATITMIMIVLAGFMVSINIILTTVDIFQVKTMSTAKKILWLALMWLLLGPIASIAYYFIEKKR